MWRWQGHSCLWAVLLASVVAAPKSGCSNDASLLPAAQRIIVTGPAPNQGLLGWIQILNGSSALIAFDRGSADADLEYWAVSEGTHDRKLAAEHAIGAAREIRVHLNPDLTWHAISRVEIRTAGSVELIGSADVHAVGDAAAAHALHILRRSLQQAGNCAVSMGGVSTSYVGCATLQGLPSPYKLYYTYNASAKAMSGAFAYPNPSGWVAFGVNPSSPGSMLGGSALVAKSDASAPSGASIDSYFLGGYTASQVQPPGRITVSDLRAAKADGDIVGAFSMALPAGTEPSAFNFLYVFGPLSPTDQLMQHEVQYGLSDVLDLTTATAPAGAASAAAPAPVMAARAPAEAAATALAPATAVAAPGTAPSDDDAAAAARGGAPEPESSKSGGDEADAASPAASASAASTTASNGTGNCLLTVGGTQEAFEACTTLTGTPGACTFHWSLLPGNKLRGGIDGVNPGGYVGWGQGPGGRKMVPGNGIIVKADSTAASGASVSDYALKGYTTSAVSHPSAWNVTDMKAAAVSGGRLLAVFTLQLDANEDIDNFPIIYTMGPVSGGVLQPHDPSNGNSASLDLSTASLSGVSSGNDRRNGDLPAVHGWLNAAGLGLLLPLAASIARTLREYPKVWFNLHRFIALIGYALGIAGIAIGSYMKPFEGVEEKAHVGLGSAALGLGFLQVLAILGRPAPDHKYRKYWALYHTNVGRLLIAIVVANFYVGVHMSNNIKASHRKNWYITYSVLLGAILALAVSKEIFNIVFLNRDKQMQHYPVEAAVRRHDKNDQDSGTSTEDTANHGDAAV